MTDPTSPPDAAAASEPSVISRYDRLGGESAVRAIIDDFVDRIFDDIMIGFFFRNADKRRIREFEFQHAAEFLGGPQRYAGRALRDAHGGHPILSAHFARRLTVLRQVLSAHAVPEDIASAWLEHNASLRDQVTEQSQRDCRD
jgi:hemoglobin